METIKYILKGHEPVPVTDTAQWGQWFETGDRVVAKAVLSGDIEVSTIFLGIDHAWGGGPPLLFETMVFGGPMDGAMDRYSTWDEAVRGHETMVARVVAANVSNM